MLEGSDRLSTRSEGGSEVLMVVVMLERKDVGLNVVNSFSLRVYFDHHHT